MHQYRFLVPSALFVYSLHMLLQAGAHQVHSPGLELSFVESVYVRFSGACRAVVDLQHGTTRGLEHLSKTIKIVQVEENITRTLPISEAFVSLTNSSVFDITRQTKIVIHGFKDNSKSPLPTGLAQAYSEKKMFNVLIVDAEELMSNWYPLTVHNGRIVGKRLANLLANLESYGANAEDFHLLGISLGAHIAGWTGKYFRQYKGRRLGRITGLDPAGPCFTYAYSDQRLDKFDATYVDVIHTNRLVQGVFEPIGHADYYLNGGGPTQPGCFTPTCSHLRAAVVYIESIKSPKSFVGVKCESWKEFLKNKCKGEFSVVGYGSSLETRGLYYLRTNSSTPYGMGMDGAFNEAKTDSLTSNFVKNVNLVI